MAITTADNIEGIYASNRLDFKRQMYYNGRQRIKEEEIFRQSDGEPKAITVYNYISYIINQTSAFSLSNKVNYVSNNNKPSSELDAYNDSYRELGINDLENFKNALITGLGIEVVSFVKAEKSVKVQSYDPSEWVILKNDAGIILEAIYLQKVKANTIYNGTILKSDVSVYTVYDEFNITVYVKRGSVMQQISVSPHFAGQVPVVNYQVLNNDMSSITPSLMDLNDDYNIIANINTDDVRYNVQALLVLIGYAQDALTERRKNKDGTITEINKLKEMRETKAISIDGEGADAKMIQNGGNLPAKVAFALKTIKDQLFIEGQVTDRDNIAGATGTASALLLRLKYQPMIAAAQAYTRYFERGLRKRIDLINVFNNKIGIANIENYKVNFTPAIPINDSEIIQNADKLLTLVDEETAISQLSFVDNPTAVIKKKNAQNISMNEKDTMTNNDVITQKANEVIEEKITIKLVTE